jgi:predicted DNA-binding transcriptional regulator AlpA
MTKASRIILGDRPPSYVSKAVLAAELCMSESTVDEYVQRGLFPKPIKIGGCVRWRWADVQASLDPFAGAGGFPDNDPFIAGLKNVSAA